MYSIFVLEVNVFSSLLPHSCFHSSLLMN